MHVSQSSDPSPKVYSIDCQSGSICIPKVRMIELRGCLLCSTCCQRKLKANREMAEVVDFDEGWVVRAYG